MCDKKHCDHSAAQMCSCISLGSTDADDLIKSIRHLYEHLIDPVWELDYTTLDEPEEHRLCVIGKCRKCGGQLCTGLHIADTLWGEELLAAIYLSLHNQCGKTGTDVLSNELSAAYLGGHISPDVLDSWMYDIQQFEKQNGGEKRRSPVCEEGPDRMLFREKFVRLFHEGDQVRIHKWLETPECRRIETVYCEAHQQHREDQQMIYTIIHTSTNTDRGSFPPPSAEGSFFSAEKARTEMWRLVGEEKEQNPLVCSEEDYEEEYGEDFWEAYEKGYAAENFSRYDIMRSELRDGPGDLEVKEC